MIDLFSAASADSTALLCAPKQGSGPLPGMWKAPQSGMETTIATIPVRKAGENLGLKTGFVLD